MHRYSRGLRLARDECADGYDMCSVLGSVSGCTKHRWSYISDNAYAPGSSVGVFVLADPKWTSRASDCFFTLQEFNDSLSVTYLASVQKSAGSVNDLADKFMAAFGHRRAI